MSNRSAFLSIAKIGIVAAILLLAAAQAFGQTGSTAQSAPTVASPNTSGPSDPGVQGGQTAPTPPPPSPATPAEGFKIGGYEAHAEFEVGDRWSPGVKGNEQVYRSQVNLRQGARLLRSYISFRGTPGSGLFDRLDLSFNNWGDPDASAIVRASRMNLYDFRASYRDLNYFNFIPSLANPGFVFGGMWAPHNLDVNYRMSNFDLTLMPNHRIVPFLGYAHNSSSGPAYTTTEEPGNEFLLQSHWKYASDEYRAGVQFNFEKLNVTVEGGYRFLKNDTGQADTGQVQGFEGTRRTVGNLIFMTSLGRSYRERIKLPTGRVLLKFNPTSNLRVTGRYIYSMATNDGFMGENRAGNFVDFTNSLVYPSAADSFNTKAKRPNHRGEFSVEFNPIRRLVLTDTIETWNYHITGDALLSTIFFNATSLFGPLPRGNVSVTDLAHTLLVYDMVRNEANAEFELAFGFSVRVGYRYTNVQTSWNDGEDPEDQPEGTVGDKSSNTGIVGIIFRPATWLRVSTDYENNTDNHIFTRTDLYHYNQWNVDWRAGSWHGFSFNGRLWWLLNENEAPDIQYQDRNRNMSAGIVYEPGRRFSVEADFTWASVYAGALIVLPQNLTTVPELFRERTKGIGGRINVDVFRGLRVEAGYRGILNQGSLPLDFHQPFASVWFPLSHGLYFKPTWQYFDFRDISIPVQRYQTHLLTFSLAFAR